MFGKQFGSEKVRFAVSSVCFLLAILPLLSCGDKNKPKSLSSNDSISKVESFDWLLGSWQRINEKANKETFEIWEKVSEKEYTGLGFTMQASDTVFQEKIKLIKSDEKWNFEVIAHEDTEATVFKITNYTALEFTCENLQNPFPKYIKYWKNNDNLSALVYDGDTMEVSFEFEKKH